MFKADIHVRSGTLHVSKTISLHKMLHFRFIIDIIVNKYTTYHAVWRGVYATGMSPYLRTFFCILTLCDAKYDVTGVFWGQQRFFVTNFRSNWDISMVDGCRSFRLRTPPLHLYLTNHGSSDRHRTDRQTSDIRQTYIRHQTDRQTDIRQTYIRQTDRHKTDRHQTDRQTYTTQTDIRHSYISDQTGSFLAQ